MLGATPIWSVERSQVIQLTNQRSNDMNTSAITLSVGLLGVQLDDGLLPHGASLFPAQG